MNTQSWGRRHEMPRLLKPFSFQVVFSGFFFGLLALVILVPALGGDYFLGFPAAFVSGLAYGALMGCLSALARRVMPKAGCLIGAGMLLVGAVAGGLIWIALQALPLSTWSSLPAPPEQAVRFAGGGVFHFFGGELVVAAQSGQFYAYKCDGESPCEWDVIDPSAQVDATPGPFPGCFDQQATGFFPPPVLGKVVDRAAARFCGVDYDIEYHYAIKDSGEILVWSRFSSWYDLVILLPLSVVAGALIGPLGLLILHRNWRKNDPGYLPPPAEVDKDWRWVHPHQEPLPDESGHSDETPDR